MKTHEPDTPNAVDQPTARLAAAQSTQTPRTFASFRHRNFQLYFGGQLISVAGTWMQIIAQGWLVYQLSHSELELGIVGFASAIPSLLVSPWGGVIVDRLPKRNLLVITQTSAMLLAFILSWLIFRNTVQVWHIIAIAALLGLVNAVDGPARQAFVVEMVGREDLRNAIALNSMMFNSARIIGPALGGLLLATVGAGWCFFINGVSFLFVIAGLLLMRISASYRADKASSPWQALIGGVRYTLEHMDLFGLILLALIFSFFGLAYSAVLPAFVDQVLKANADAYGWINAASGVGAVTGAFLIARYGHSKHTGRWLIAANLSFPIVLALFAYTSWLPLALLLALGLGFGFMIEFTLINTMLQTRVSDEMRGRVMSLYTITFFGFAPFGNLLMGWLSEVWGLSPSIALGAGATLLLTLLTLRSIPQLREL
jgi:MFS family permease